MVLLGLYVLIVLEVSCIKYSVWEVRVVQECVPNNKRLCMDLSR
jgi:hypothetical protein